MTRALFLLLAVLVSGLSCGGADFRMGNAWQDTEARFFDDGVDLIGDMSQLSGRYAYEQEDAMTGRAQLADLVAEVEILSIQTNIDIHGTETKRLTVRIVDKLFGVAPEDTFSVASGSSSPGYNFIRRYEKRLVGQFVLFVRWFQQEDGSVGHHFHLSPATKEIKKAVRGLIRDRESELKTRVIEK